jgi:PhzF family phenazine biosynthesis protein
VRYFAPEVEVDFCGHATIALGAALALRCGDGTFRLEINNASITVEGWRTGSTIFAALQSPPTRSKPASSRLVAEALTLFSYSPANAGADHLVLALKSRERLSAMHYELDAGRRFAAAEGIVTISLVTAETSQRFHARNPFPIGGVYEDPATGAAAAALAGYLRDLGWPHRGAIEIIQGEDMGVCSRLHAQIPVALGASIRVSGTVRLMQVSPVDA